MICCVEEIAYRMGYIGAEDVARIAAPMRRNSYGEYLLRMLEQEAAEVTGRGAGMIVTPTATLPDVLIIEPRVLRDDRGFFVETYHAPRYRAAGIDVDFVQDNHSRSVRGTLRGLHWQTAPHPQAKLIRVLDGEILDVAVDVREGSPTFGRWVGGDAVGRQLPPAVHPGRLRARLPASPARSPTSNTSAPTSTIPRPSAA